MITKIKAKLGKVYTTKFNGEINDCLLARVGPSRYCLIVLDTGNRWEEPVDSLSKIETQLTKYNFKPTNFKPKCPEEETVRSLREKGYKVRVLHQREIRPFEYEMVDLKKEKIVVFEAEIKPNEKGGTTRVEITTPDGEELVGEAICNPSDHYNKKEGVKIALRRALEK